MTVAHSTLTGAELHITKGADTSTVGKVPVASGSGDAPFGTLVNDSVPTGWPVQTTMTETTSVASGSTNFPLDDTIPQNTEGDQFMTHSHTPKSTTNILIITVTLAIANSTRTYLMAALFKDATASALAAIWHTNSGGEGAGLISFAHKMTAGTVSAITFKVRGGSDGGTTTFNGFGGTRLFGGVSASSIRVDEYKT